MLKWLKWPIWIICSLYFLSFPVMPFLVAAGIIARQGLIDFWAFWLAALLPVQALLGIASEGHKKC